MSGRPQRWATGRPGAEARPASGQTDLEPGQTGLEPGQTRLKSGRTDVAAGRTDVAAGRPDPAARAGGPFSGTLREFGDALAQSGDLAAEWAPTAGRILLGLVFAWFGYHELEHPGAWTGYVPVLSETSNLAIAAVLIHGWILFMLAVALVAGIVPRAAAAVASVLMLEIVVSLVVSGLSDTALRDVGVLGLAVCLTGCRHFRLVLRG